MADREVREAERYGQLLGEIELARARRPVVHLLKKDDVGVVVMENGDDALGPEAPVDADGAVNVVGDESDLQERCSPRFRGTVRPAWAEAQVI